MTAEDVNKALQSSKDLGVEFSKTTIVLTPEEKNVLSLPVDAKVSVISARGLVPAEELAIAVYALYKTAAAKKVLESLDEKIAGKVITPETKQNLNEMLAGLDKGTLSFSDDMKLTDEVSKDVASIKQDEEQFMDAI
ncbi:MAG: hypothetical protein KKH29_02545 [Candidatus Omnitrophica bacterium]|nr:hypothetical protein [Candidatus Omnitrophota bacterium]MBU4346189.1 hypothetical protein [Candidatus Omnitrophota bacterium]